MTQSYAEVMKGLEAIYAERKELDQRESVLFERLQLPFFDEGKRIIVWRGNCLKLGKKHYKVFTSLYFAENRFLTITELETAGWGETSDKNIIVTVNGLDTILSDANFPCSIESVLSDGGETQNRTQD